MVKSNEQTIDLTGKPSQDDFISLTDKPSQFCLIAFAGDSR
jgi:hypothetical protein